MTDPVQQIAEATGLPHEAAREVLDAMTDRYVRPSRQPLGRVARIFHRRGMWSLSADMLAQSAAPDETPAQAKASDDSAPPQP
jgi:hypothetical protein